MSTLNRLSEYNRITSGMDGIGMPSPHTHQAPLIGMSSAAGPHSHGFAPSPFEASPIQMIAMRLRVPPGQKLPFDHVNAYLSDKVAAVFIVQNGKVVVLEDEPAIFPSDKLIAELRLLIG